MKRILQRTWSETDGVLSFEWTLLLTLLTIGIVSGIAGARDAIVDELSDVAHAAVSLDQSYFLAELTIDIDDDGTVDITISESSYEDTFFFEACDRTDAPEGQDPETDAPA